MAMRIGYGAGYAFVMVEIVPLNALSTGISRAICTIIIRAKLAKLLIFQIVTLLAVCANINRDAVSAVRDLRIAALASIAIEPVTRYTLCAENNLILRKARKAMILLQRTEEA